jgi:hypothetical protein
MREMEERKINMKTQEKESRQARRARGKEGRREGGADNGKSLRRITAGSVRALPCHWNICLKTHDK